MTTCSEIMTETPRACLPNDSLENAAKLMKTENVGSIPIVESPDTRRLVGIITDRDIALQIAASHFNPQGTKIEEIMSRDPIVCHESDTIQSAMDAMAAHQVRRIPVVDNEHRLVGIIAQGDIALRVPNPEKAGKVVKEISKPDEHDSPVR